MRNLVFDAIKRHHNFITSAIPLIASENVTSKFVRYCYTSDFGHRYAIGEVGSRIYSGCSYIDEVEKLAIDLTKKLFGCEHVNVKPISGTVANLAVYKALTNCGDTIMSLPIKCGGHFSHHDSAELRCLRVEEIPFNAEVYNVDVDALRKKVKQTKPKLIILGASVFLFPHPVREVVEIAHEIDAKVVYDASHVLGLIAGKEFQDPIKEGADVVTASTHKTFPGPQRGVIMCKGEFAESIDYAVMPCLVSNHHIHSLAGYVMACLEMLEFGREYARQIVKNAKALAEALYDLGFKVLCPDLGFTKSHQVVVEVENAEKAVATLEKSKILTNPCLLPWNSDKPTGIRLGVQEVTRLGMKEDEMRTIAEFMHKALEGKDVSREVEEFRREYNTIKYTFEEHDVLEM
jgi:glycine hydroxymethyltransferase